VAEIRLKGITKRFEGAKRATLQPLDLTIPDGELVVLVGPSGCGKSTTLRIIAGLEEPTSGDVFIDARRVTDVQPADRDIAMVFQSYALYPHMSVYENLAFALRMRKVDKKEIDRRVRAAAQSLGIEDLLDRRPKQLSGGQRQRVAIGRAVVRDPKVFLFDEPLSNLDAQLRSEMRREIARIHARAKTTAVYVTHDQTEAMTLADRIVVMKDGAVQQLGTPLELYDSPANLFVAGFLGSPSMNFLRAQLTMNGDGRPAAALPGWRAALAHGSFPAVDKPDIVLGVRPQDLSLSPRGNGQPLAARVEVRELMGSEAYLHLASDAGPIVVRTEAHAAAREGENVSVWVDPSKLHVFDPATERRI
jgi:multiple sugar transport system ATP-binding protein